MPGAFCLVANELDYLDHNGGIGVNNWQVVHLLASHGWRVHVLYCGSATDQEKFNWVRKRLGEKGIAFSTMNDVSLPPAAEVSGWPTGLLQESERVRHALERLDRDTPFNLVKFAEHLGMGLRAVQAKRSGLAFTDVGIIVKLHGMGQWDREWNQRWPDGINELIVDFAERHSFEEADFPVAASRRILEYAGQLGWTPRVTPEILRNPVAKPVLPAPADCDDPIHELVFFGRLDRLKGLELFLSAVEKLDPHIRITFLGRDQGVAEGVWASDRITERLAGRTISLLTNYDRDQALNYLTTGNRLAVIPSLMDNYPNTVVECASHGIPFLASRIGGIPEIVHDPELQDILLFKPNPMELVRCLTSYLQAAPTKRRQWRDRARDGLNVDKHNQQIVEAYETLLSRVMARPVSPVLSKEKPLVTVGVTHYNLGGYLPETLAGLSQQTYPKLEILVLDDGSTDVESLRIFAEQEAIYPKFRFVRQANGGLEAARNRLLAEAKGEFFLPFDGDDIPMPIMVERLAEAMLRNPNSSVMTPFHLAFQNSDDLAAKKFLYAFRPPGGPQILTSVLNVTGVVHSLFRTAELRAVGGYNPRRGYQTSGEDRIVFIKMLRAGYRIDVVPEYLYYYRVRSDSMFHTRDVFASQFRVLENMFEPQAMSRADSVVLWTALAGFHHRMERLSRQRDELQKLVDRLQAEGQELYTHSRNLHAQLQATSALRHRLVNKANSLVKRVPLVHRTVRAIIESGLRVWKQRQKAG